MSAFIPTNIQIAELLEKQTYDERMEMAEWFREVLNDQKAGMEAQDGFDASDLARLFSIWAQAEMENAVEESP